MLIRAYEEQDLPQVLELSNVRYQNRKGFSSLATKLKNQGLLRSYIASYNEKIIGYALLGGQDPLNKKVRLEFVFHPDYEEERYLSSLYNRIALEIPKINPVVIQTRVFEENIGLAAFFENLGFKENHRMVQASLAFKDFDPSLYVNLEKQLQQNYIYITTLAEELLINTECLNQLHDLDNATSPNFPRDHLEVFIPRSFEQSAIVREDPNTMYIAKYGDRYVGYSHFKILNNQKLQQGNTAVLKEFWKKGVATALKARILQYGKDHGYQEIKTSYRNNNIPMKTVNEQKLGFVPISSEIRLEKLV